MKEEVTRKDKDKDEETKKDEDEDKEDTTEREKAKTKQLVKERRVKVIITNQHHHKSMQDLNTKGMFKWRKSKGVQASFNSQVCSALREFWLSGGSNHLYLSSSKVPHHPQRQCVHKLDKAHGGCDVCYQCTECRSFFGTLCPASTTPVFSGKDFS